MGVVWERTNYLPFMILAEDYSCTHLFPICHPFPGCLPFSIHVFLRNLEKYGCNESNVRKGCCHTTVDPTMFASQFKALYYGWTVPFLNEWHNLVNSIFIFCPFYPSLLNKYFTEHQNKALQMIKLWRTKMFIPRSIGHSRPLQYSYFIMEQKPLNYIEKIW